MSLAVRVMHPAWATFVPARGRNERTRLVQATTEAFVPETPASAFERAPLAVHDRETATAGGEILLGEGALWRPIRGEAADGWGGDACPAWFAQALSRTVEGHDRVGWSFVGTPIRATEARELMTGASPGHSHGFPEQGERVDLDAARSIPFDGRDAAARAVRDFLASEVRVAGDRVLRRYRPVGLLMTGQDRRGVPCSANREHLPAGVFVGRPPFPGWYDAIPTRPSTLEGALGMIPERRRPPLDESVRGWMALGDEVVGARDGADLVDGYACAVSALLREMLAIHRFNTQPRAELQVAYDRLAPHVRAARTGTPDAGVADALAAMEAGLAVLNRNPPSTDYHADRRYLRTWIRERFRPDHERIPEDDDMALAGLGPRP